MYSEQAVNDQATRTPLVLLHSSMSDRTQWRKLDQQLANHYRVIAIDLYGYGGSEYPADHENFTLAQEATRVGHLISQQLGEQPFHLIGHSYGGATALRLAYEQPSRILSLGLYEPVAFHLLEPGEPAYRLIKRVDERVAALLAQGDTSEAASHFIDFWSGPGTFLKLPEDRRILLEQDIPKVSLDFQAIFGEPLKAVDYRRLNLPICLLRSRESPLSTRRVAEILEQHLPRMEAHWVKGGHMAPITNAEAVNPHWIEFLERNSA